MKFASRALFAVACVMGAATVLLAAYTAHMGESLSPAALRSVQSAMQMQQFHVLALLLVGAIALLHSPSKTLLLSGGLLLAGLLMFSLNIHLIHLAGVDSLRAATPYGGMAFVAGWLCWAWWAWRLKP
jgi:uncharacterized membrane protein YgdD (TMEM256/DUF423 family)